MKTGDVKSSLIDSKAGMPTRAKRKQAERLSERTPQGDAIVRTTQESKLRETGRNDQFFRL